MNTFCDQCMDFSFDTYQPSVGMLPHIIVRDAPAALRYLSKIVPDRFGLLGREPNFTRSGEGFFNEPDTLDYVLENFMEWEEPQNQAILLNGHLAGGGAELSLIVPTRTEVNLLKQMMATENEGWPNHYEVVANLDKVIDALGWAVFQVGGVGEYGMLVTNQQSTIVETISPLLVEAQIEHFPLKFIKDRFHWGAANLEHTNCAGPGQGL